MENEDHIVQEGESIANIAFRNGYFPETLWNHPANSVLRSNRASGYVLSPGDILHIPDVASQE